MTTHGATSYLSSDSDEPRFRISSANPAENVAETAINTGAKLARPQPTNPRPPHRSGCVAVSSRSSPETRNKNDAQSTNTHSQRSRKKNKIGRLTKACHQPASVSDELTRSQLELLAVTPSPTRTTSAREKATIRMAISGIQDSRRRTVLSRM